MNKTIFIIGNGPSLNVLPIEQLKDYDTICVNFYIPHGIEKYDFLPKYWASAYSGCANKHIADIINTAETEKIMLVLPEDYLSIIKKGWKPSISPVVCPTSDNNNIIDIKQKFINTECPINVIPINKLPPRFYGCGVITHTVIPFCIQQGYTNIVFVGMDLGGYNLFYNTGHNLNMKQKRHGDIRTCWDGLGRSNIDAVFNLNKSIFSRKILEYNELIPDIINFYHTTPYYTDDTVGFAGVDNEGFYIHELEQYGIQYIDFEKALMKFSLATTKTRKDTC